MAISEPSSSSTWLTPAARHRRRRLGAWRSEERTQIIRYGVGMGIGLAAVHLSKTIIKAIPVLGKVAAPIINLIPSILVGPALGAAVVFAMDEGDVDRAGRKVRRAVDNVGHSVRREAGDLRRGQPRSELSQRLDDRIASIGEGLEGAQRRVIPAVERQVANMQNQLARLHKSRQQAAAAGRNADG